MTGKGIKKPYVEKNGYRKRKFRKEKSVTLKLL